MNSLYGRFYFYFIVIVWNCVCDAEFEEPIMEQSENEKLSMQLSELFLISQLQSDIRKHGLIYDHYPDSFNQLLEFRRQT